MTEVLSEVADWARRQGDIWRIGAVYDGENSASGRVMERSALERESILRGWLVHPNITPQPHDCFSYAK
jgi:[ribosomal protein S5]-alanine N-acetyltransferase